jgi:hypothetical protein
LTTASRCVLGVFVSPPPTVPDSTAQPAPSQDRPPVSAEPSPGATTPGATLDATVGASPGATPRATPHVERLRGLVRWVIAYGQHLAVTLQRRADPVRLAALAFRFQTTDLGVILARIARGLMLAGALEEKLARLTEAGRDLTPDRLRLPSVRAPRGKPPAGQPGVHPCNIIDLPLDRLPSAEAIAAELRRRPIGAVLADICRDLGMLPGDLADGRWKELADAVSAYGGNVVTLMFGFPMFDKAMAAARRVIAAQPPTAADIWVLPELPPGEAARSTGPPEDARQLIAA